MTAQPRPPERQDPAHLDPDPLFVEPEPVRETRRGKAPKRESRVTIEAWPLHLWLRYRWGRVLGWLDGWRR